MAAGRKPKPTKLKLLTGTAQPCRMNDKEPKPKSDNIKMPAGLSEKAKKCWRLVAKQLTDAGVLTNLDVHALAMYCEVFTRWQDANEKLAKFGPVIKAPSGFPVQSPYLQISNKSFDQMKSMLVEFGMTPSSRTRVSVVDQQEVSDPVAEFMAGAKKRK